MFHKFRTACQRVIRSAAVFLSITVAISVTLALVGLWVEAGDFYRKYLIPSVLSLGIAIIVWWRTDATLRGWPTCTRGEVCEVSEERYSCGPTAVLALSFAESWVSAAIKHAANLYTARPAQKIMLPLVPVVTVITVGTSAYLVWVLTSETVIRDADQKS